LAYKFAGNNIYRDMPLGR